MQPIIHTTKIRVRYPETDAMGYVHHSIYPQYYEIGRVEMLRDRGISYKEMEDSGIMLPVRKIEITFFKPAHYDDELTITTILKEKPNITLEFDFEIRNQHNELLNTANVLLVFADTKTGKPNRAGHLFIQKAFGFE
jgi:acyl-CoA thioester hydrolase